MTEELKELLKNAKTEEEAKQILENHKAELNDDELAAVSGGFITTLTIVYSTGKKIIKGKRCEKL